MRNLFELIEYEYKKMFMRKSTVITVVLALFISSFVQFMVLMPGLTANVTPWEIMTSNRDYARALNGRVIDGELIYNAHIGRGYLNLTEGPYAEIYRITQNALNNFAPQSPKEAEQFYYLLHNQVSAGDVEFLRRANRISESGAEWIMRQSEGIPSPWEFEYFGGYNNFFMRLSSVVSILFFAIAICLAPLFAAEHGTGVAQLILTSKYGKNKLIWAKILTAVSFSIGISLLFLLGSYLINMAVFGADGGSAIIQLFWPTSLYQFTMRQTTAIYTLAAAARAMMFGAAVLFFSAKLKSSFGTMIISSIWLVMALVFFVPLPIRWLVDLSRLLVEILPDMTHPYMSALSNVPYEIFGMFIPPFIVEPIFSLILGAIILFFAGRVFKRYQVG